MNRYLRVLVNPPDLLGRLVQSVRPDLLWRRFDRLAEKAGFSQLFLSLSFDCDTDQDANYALQVDDRLRALGISPSYAVPGELLLRNEQPYRTLMERGAEFLNHGFREHTIYNPITKINESTFFYDQATRAEVEMDVREGHRILKDHFGITPRGFRTPHFGTFQRNGQLCHLYELLEDLEYEYSSSGMPLQTVRRGSIYPVDRGRHGTLLEIPLTGYGSHPLRLYDSWTFFARPTGSPGAFLEEALGMAKSFRQDGRKGVLNYYADPAHIKDREEFFKAMEALTSIAKPIVLGDLAGALRLNSVRSPASS